jgi:hypothetical protein
MFLTYWSIRKMTQQHANNIFRAGAASDAGEWMYFPEAMTATGLTERSLRRYMQTGQIQYRKLGKSANARVQLFVTPELRTVRLREPSARQADNVPDIFDADIEYINVSPPTEDAQSDTPSARADYEQLRCLAEQMITPLIQTIREQERQIEEQSRQMRLLPDLQKQAEEERKNAELAVLETEALKKQIAAMNEELTRLKTPWWKFSWGSRKPKDSQA